MKNQTFRSFLSHLKNSYFVSGVGNAADYNRSIINWYIQSVKGANLSQLKITDGPKDGNIDAIFFSKNKEKCHVIQSKFSINPAKIDKKSLEDINSFDRTIDIFKNEVKFQEYISKVNKSHQEQYKMVYKLYTNDKNNVDWIFLCTSKSETTKSYFKNQVTEVFLDDILHYFSLDIENGTPISENIQLDVINNVKLEYTDDNIGVNSIVFRTRLLNLKKYLEKNEGKLEIISRNIRNDLNSKINENIRKSYENTPEEFWYGHNGITIICRQTKAQPGSIIIHEPNIINGAQTLTSINKSKVSNKNAEVLCKVFEIYSQESHTQFINNIIERSNTSNAILPSDLKANNPRLVSLAKYLFEKGFYFARRRGDFDYYKKNSSGVIKHKEISSVDFVMILSCDYPSMGSKKEPGLVIAKAQKQSFFSDETLFNKLFSLSDSRAFVLLIIYKNIDLVLKNNQLFKRSKTTTSERKIPIYVICCWIFKNIIDVKNERYILNHISLLKNNSLGYSKNESFQKVIEDIFSKIWKGYKSESAKNDSLTASDYFKSKDVIIKISNLNMPLNIKRLNSILKK